MSWGNSLTFLCFIFIQWFSSTTRTSITSLRGCLAMGGTTCDGHRDVGHAFSAFSVRGSNASAQKVVLPKLALVPLKDILCGNF